MAQQSAPKKLKPNTTPADSATYLEGDMPQYQSDSEWNIHGKKVKPNKMQNPFDPKHGSNERN